MITIESKRDFAVSDRWNDQLDWKKATELINIFED